MSSMNDWMMVVVADDFHCHCHFVLMDEKCSVEMIAPHELMEDELNQADEASLHLCCLMIQSVDEPFRSDRSHSMIAAADIYALCSLCDWRQWNWMRHVCYCHLPHPLLLLGHQH